MELKDYKALIPPDNKVATVELEIIHRHFR